MTLPIANHATTAPDATLRRCFDCRHMRAAVSWWCTNKEAIAHRGTSIPGIRDCGFWAGAEVKR